MIFFIRRIFLVVVTVLVEYVPSLELLTLFYMNLLIFVFVGNQDIFKDKKFHMSVIFNETCIFHLTILMSLFTDFCPDPLNQYRLGWIFIVEFLVFLSYNLWLMLKPTLYFLARKIKLYALRYYNRRIKAKAKMAREVEEQLQVEVLPERNEE